MDDLLSPWHKSLTYNLETPKTRYVPEHHPKRRVLDSKPECVVNSNSPCHRELPVRNYLRKPVATLAPSIVNQELFPRHRAAHRTFRPPQRILKRCLLPKPDSRRSIDCSFERGSLCVYPSLTPPLPRQTDSPDSLKLSKAKGKRFLVRRSQLFPKSPSPSLWKLIDSCMEAPVRLMNLHGRFSY